MILITKYDVKYNKNDKNYQINSKEDLLLCPVCESVHLKFVCWRNRKVVDTNNNLIVLNIRRLRCHECKKIHHELPDFLVPYKRHCRKTIEKIIAGDMDGVGCEDSTVVKIKIWWNAVRLYFLRLIELSVIKYEINFNKPVKVREVIKVLANKHLWVNTRLEYKSG